MKRSGIVLPTLLLGLVVAACSESEPTSPLAEDTVLTAVELPIGTDETGAAVNEGRPAVMSAPVARRTEPSEATAADGVILPNAYATVMGNFNNTFPFTTANMRYQQVFLGDELDGMNSIGGLCIRRDEAVGGPARTHDFVIKMGPTTMDFTNLGSNFDANYSAAPTTVFSASAAVPESSGGGTPDDFHLCIEFDRNYANPAGSNFIVEVINNGPGEPPQFNDACIQVGPLLCTTRRAYAFSAAATSADFVFDSGMIMKFFSGDPQTKDECKNDGWEQHGFRNQGQCVRFVETGKDSR